MALELKFGRYCLKQRDGCDQRALRGARTGWGQGIGKVAWISSLLRSCGSALFRALPHSPQTWLSSSPAGLSADLTSTEDLPVKEDPLDTYSCCSPLSPRCEETYTTGNDSLFEEERPDLTLEVHPPPLAFAVLGGRGVNQFTSLLSSSQRVHNTGQASEPVDFSFEMEPGTEIAAATTRPNIGYPGWMVAATTESLVSCPRASLPAVPSQPRAAFPSVLQATLQSSKSLFIHVGWSPSLLLAVREP